VLIVYVDKFSSCAGAGLGLPSMACATLGARRVTATDLEVQLPVLKANLEMNFELRRQEGKEKDDSGGQQEFAGQENNSHSQGKQGVFVSELSWGKAKGKKEVVSVVGGECDVVLCSDILFGEEALDLLVDTVDALTAPRKDGEDMDGGNSKEQGTKLVISCCVHRWAGAVRFYEELKKRGFQVAEAPSEVRHPNHRGESWNDVHLVYAWRRAPPSSIIDE